jgi:hypothetical protein
MGIGGALTSTCAFELMKPVAWPAQVFNGARCFKVGEYQFDLLDTRGADAAAIATFEEAFKTAMPETDDHGQDSYDNGRLSIVAARGENTWNDHEASGTGQVEPVAANCCRNMARPVWRTPSRIRLDWRVIFLPRASKTRTV